MKPTLVFVYNADTGFFNLVADIAHKIFSPATYPCQLCALTHSTFSMYDEWKEYIAALELSLEFLHRDELQQQYGVADVPLPAIFYKAENGRLDVWLDAPTINGCQSLGSLKGLITARLAQPATQ